MRRLATLLLLVALGTTTACLKGDDRSTPDAGPGDAGPTPDAGVCAAGDTEACDCAGDTGVRTCEGGAWGACVCPSACTASSLVAAGTVDLGGSSVDYTGAEVSTTARHKVDADAAEDGCLSSAVFTVQRPGGGCTLELRFGAFEGSYGGLLEVRLSADSHCPGFPDVDEGLYVSEAAYGAAWFSGPTAVPQREAATACLGDVTLQLPSTPVRLVREDGATQRTLDLSGLSFSGDWFTTGDTAAVCVNVACAPGLHDGGTGWCVASDACAPGYWDGGDGSCVPEGTCAAGYHDGGIGTCLPDGTCEDAYHDGGDGTCVLSGTCADGYRPGAGGVCEPASPCSAGLEVSPGRLDFGSVRLGQSGHAALSVTNPADYDACPVGSLDLVAGSDPAFSLPAGAWKDLVLAPGETRVVDVVFSPVALGAHTGTLAVTVAAGSPRLVNLVGRGTDVDVAFDPATVDLGTARLACGPVSTDLCVVNGGTAAFGVTALQVTGASDLRLVSLPALPSTVDPSGRLCFAVRYTPTAVGTVTGTVRVRLDTGDTFTTSVTATAAESPTQTERFVQGDVPKADILWTVDNSASMQNMQNGLSASAPAILTLLEDAGVDYHLGVISTDVTDNGALRTAGTSTTPLVDGSLADPAGTFAQNVLLGTEGSYTEQGLEQARLALSEPTLSGTNGGFLRPGSTLAIVFVSDEDDQSLDPTDDYVTFFEGLGHDFVASAIVALSAGCGAGVGARYEAVANATGGSVGSICTPDWTAPIQALVDGLGFQSRFQLTGVPEPGALSVEVRRPDGSTYVPAGWTWDGATNSVVLGSEVPQPGETLEVTYVPAC